VLESRISDARELCMGDAIEPANQLRQKLFGSATQNVRREIDRIPKKTRRRIVVQPE
jgi:hypothetical protein